MITIINPYYDNPSMLIRQFRQWGSYSHDILRRLRVIVVDDCSPNHPAEDAVAIINHYLNVALTGFQFRLYRIKVNVRWNWLVCRNLGAMEADEGSWLLLTDIDHLVPDDTMNYLWWGVENGKFNKKRFYLFNRVDAPNLTPYKRHPNSYFMHRDLYWKIGGYDEEFSGNYGTDGMYRRRAVATAGEGRPLDVPLIRYPREVIPDASTTEFTRKEGRDPAALSNIRRRKRLAGRIDDIKILSFPWERLL